MVSIESTKLCIKKDKCGQKKIISTFNFISYIGLNILYCMAQFAFSTFFDTKRHNALVEWLPKFKCGQKKMKILLNLHKLYAIMLAKIVKTFVRQNYG